MCSLYLRRFPKDRLPTEANPTAHPPTPKGSRRGGRRRVRGEHRRDAREGGGPLLPPRPGLGRREAVEAVRGPRVEDGGGARARPAEGNHGMEMCVRVCVCVSL